MKSCGKCGQPMAVLFHLEFYCPNCENADPNEDPWDIQFRSVRDCTHASKHHYVSESRVFCRSCGTHLRDL